MFHIVDTQNLFAYIHYRGFSNAVNERMNYHHQVVHDFVSQKYLLEVLAWLILQDVYVFLV